MLEHKDFEIITFDCYGTLIDWEGGITKAFQDEATKVNLELSREDIIKAHIAIEPIVESEEYRSYREVLTEVAIRMAAQFNWLIDRQQASFLPDSLPNWQPFPDTNGALERLAGKFRLGLLSNIDNDLIAQTCRLFTVKFDLIITAEEVRSYKPAPGHFRAGLARTPKGRWLHAAQSYYHDVTMARALDIPVVWVNRKDEAIAPGDVEPDDEVRNLAGLADLLGV